MSRTRISTTVDEDLLETVRTQTGLRDSELFDLALESLARLERGRVIDEKIMAGYAAQPLSTPDDWGDLESFSKAVRKGNHAEAAEG